MTPLNWCWAIWTPSAGPTAPAPSGKGRSRGCFEQAPSLRGWLLGWRAARFKCMCLYLSCMYFPMPYPCVNGCVCLCVQGVHSCASVYVCVCTCECVSIRAGWGEGLNRGHTLTRPLDRAGHSPLCGASEKMVSSRGCRQAEGREQGPTWSRDCLGPGPELQLREPRSCVCGVLLHSSRQRYSSIENPYSSIRSLILKLRS